MEINWIIVGVALVIGAALVVYLILKNHKDEKDVVDYFNNESSTFKEDEDEDEFNNER